jgi:glucose/arabinose dehydrogenase
MRRLGVALLLGLSWSCQSSAQPDPQPNKVTVPSGFRLEVYAKVPGARHMTVAPDGTLFVGTREERVYRVSPERKVSVIADNLNSPNGVAFRDGTLYIAEIDRLSRAPQIMSAGKARLETLCKLPESRHHGHRVLRFGPDGRLYIGLGSPSNASVTPEPNATLARFSADYRKVEIYARGVRNTMGFDWNPADGKLWFTDNGRDMLGDDIPPEELNYAPAAGMHFGFPYRHGNNLPDPELGNRAPAGVTFTPPAGEMQAHTAPLGMRFYRGRQFPDEYRGSAFIAQHGSWNRSVPVGYQVVNARISGGKVQFRPFATGWLAGGKLPPKGRPVDVEELPDGSLAISDDHAGSIYRLSYGSGGQ